MLLHLHLLLMCIFCFYFTVIQCLLSLCGSGINDIRKKGLKFVKILMDKTKTNTSLFHPLLKCIEHYYQEIYLDAEYLPTVSEYTKWNSYDTVKKFVFSSHKAYKVGANLQFL